MNIGECTLKYINLTKQELFMRAWLTAKQKLKMTDLEARKSSLETKPSGYMS